MTEQSSCEGTRVSGVARHVATAGKVGAIAVLGIALFASPVCAPHAGAADLFPKGSNATLVFSPTTIGDGEGAELCAWNTSDVAVQVTFVFTRLSAGHQSSASPATIGAGDLKCDTLVNTNSFFGASIVLESPFQCSQAAEYPGKCGVVASLEIREFSGDVITGPARLHTEPVLKPASPRLQPPLIAPQ
jgi:hypothetical protein